MKIHNIIALLLLAMALPMNTAAQVNSKAPVLVVAYDQRTVNWKGNTITVPLQTNIDDISVQTTENWLRAVVVGNKVKVSTDINTNLFTRVGKVIITAGDIVREVAIEQEPSKMAEDVVSVKEFGIFADKLYTQLREGVTQTDIDTIKSLYVRSLAQRIFDGTYDFKYRTGTYPCLTDPSKVGNLWGTGKSYDIIQGVTGIMVHPGRFIVAADGIPEGQDVTVKLCVYQWTVPEGEYVKNHDFKLKNGLNICDCSLKSDGLVYISYYSNTPEKFQPLSIHIMDGIQNGYIDNTMTNDECYEMCSKATYNTIDVIGDKVHSVWEAPALMKYTQGKFRKLINLLDTLLTWEHRLQGLEKYNLVPENKSLAYVNYNYYMYQGGLGVTFKYDQQYRTLDPDRLIRSDDDCIWGYSHEWGHQHQISPYFCWAGMSETTNNMNSTYNVLHLGYAVSHVHRELGEIRKSFLTSSLTGNSVHRYNAYKERSKFAWNSKMYAMYESMADSAMHDRNENFERASTTQENYPNAYTIFWSMHEYMTKYVYEDFTLDLYQAMRETNYKDDKYAILAAAQNVVSGKWDEYQQKYPESCWVTDGYIRSTTQKWDNSVPYIFNFIRQASLISGYNLFDIYDNLGFMRTIAMSIGDYGTKYYCMTKEMKDEFRADMNALVEDGTLQLPPADMLEVMLDDSIITHYPRPEIPN